MTMQGSVVPVLVTSLLIALLGVASSDSAIERDSVDTLDQNTNTDLTHSIHKREAVGVSGSADADQKAASKRFSSFRRDLGKRASIDADEVLKRVAFGFPDDLGEGISDGDFDPLDEEAEKRFAGFRRDLGKRYSGFRRDLGKRLASFRRDLGKRNTNDDTEDAMEKRYRGFNSDLGKRQYDYKRYMFRKDLGKRSSGSSSNLGQRYSGFRWDLGKRYSGFRRDLGKRAAEILDGEMPEGTWE